MKNVDQLTVSVDDWEDEKDTGRIYMIASIPRKYLSNCQPCNKLRKSDRLYFVTYNELGGDQFGWKGLEQDIVKNKAIGGILDFLSK